MIDPLKVEELTTRKANLFNELLVNREYVKSRYSIDVYYIPNDDEDERIKWIETYGYDSKKLNSKGIYKIFIKPNV